MATVKASEMRAQTSDELLAVIDDYLADNDEV